MNAGGHHGQTPEQRAAVLELTGVAKPEMKSIAIMQPYFFPYIGYWQLIHAVDRFVIHNDVNYIRRGWVNRNGLLINGEPAYITV